MFSILFQLVINTVNIFILILLGFAGNSKYTFIGSVRNTAQVLSQELIFSSLVLIIILTGNTLTLSRLIEYQIDLYNGYGLFSVHILFIITCVAETNRAPFDLSEAEAELVAGYNTEQPGLQFSLIFIAEYSNLVGLSCNNLLMFFGGSLFSTLAIIIEVISIIKFVLLRSSFPRYRQDQLMLLC